MQRVLAACVGLLSLCAVLPLTAAAMERPVMLYATDGRALHAAAALLWLGERGQGGDAGFRLQPVHAPDADVHDGDAVYVRSEDGRYLTHWGRYPLLTRQRQLAVRWHVVRAAGEGVLGLADAFALRTSDGRFELGTRHGLLSMRAAGQSPPQWSIGCYFSSGPFAGQWADAVSFDVVQGERASEVSRAVAWLQSAARNVRMPRGDLPLIVWDDPSLQPDPTVGYLITDTLWAAKALAPYDPELSDNITRALIAAGWYGNGLNDTLFHGVEAIAHRPASSDVVHGTLLDRCSSFGAAPGAVQLHVPEVTPDPAWTDGNSAQFVDSALYTALNDHWNGHEEEARARIREVILDTRGSGSDTMFWDNERWVMVDQASRCDYDAVVGTCSTACPSCVPCQGPGCGFYNASFKLGLLLYAARVTGLADDPALSRPLADIEYRLWEGQLDDGGLAHLMLYAPNGALVVKSGATGEATAISVLAHSVVTPDRSTSASGTQRTGTRPTPPR